MAIQQSNYCNWAVIFLIAIISTVHFISTNGECRMKQGEAPQKISLPEPQTDGSKSLEKVLAGRRSIRSFSDSKLGLGQVGQLLWAAQGITDSRGFRTTPSAGALYPLRIYVISGDNAGLPMGVYQYLPESHSLRVFSGSDIRENLFNAALSQAAVKKAPITFVITAVYKKTTVKYGQRGFQYVFMEAGHAAQNILLQAESLGLGSVPIGAFDDKAVKRLIEFDPDEYPLYILPVGIPTEH